MKKSVISSKASERQVESGKVLILRSCQKSKAVLLITKQGPNEGLLRKTLKFKRQKQQMFRDVLVLIVTICTILS